MKKTLIIILALMLAFLPACSGASHQQDEGTQTTGSGAPTDSAEASGNQETGESGQTNGEPGQSAEGESNPQSEESSQPAAPPKLRDFPVLGCAGHMSEASHD